jgi:glycosyltransferase involved in cell wall biosynthesis
MNRTAGTIATVLHDFPLGGSERIAIRLMNRWAEMGRKVVVFAGTLNGPLVGMIGRNVDVVECFPRIPRGYGSRRKLGQALARYVEKNHTDTLFVPGNFHWPALPDVAAVSKDRRPSVVAQISTPLYRHGRGPAQQIVYNMLTRHRLACADAAISLAPSVITEADKILGRRITQCIRLPALEDMSGGTVFPRAEGNLIVAAGRLVKEKGFDVALKAFARLPQKDARLLILGEGPERAALTALAASLGLTERVHVQGYVPDIQPWLAQARVFLLSSYYEGYGAVIVKALAAGRPVVSTDCGPAASELLRGLDGCAIAPIGDHVGLGDALARVLASAAPDPHAMANAVAGYRIGPIAEKYLKVFDRVHAQKWGLAPEPAEHFAEEMVYV